MIDKAPGGTPSHWGLPNASRPHTVPLLGTGVTRPSLLHNVIYFPCLHLALGPTANPFYKAFYTSRHMFSGRDPTTLQARTRGRCAAVEAHSTRPTKRDHVCTHRVTAVLGRPDCDTRTRTCTRCSCPHDFARLGWRDARSSCARAPPRTFAGTCTPAAGTPARTRTGTGSRPDGIWPRAVQLPGHNAVHPPLDATACTRGRGGLYQRLHRATPQPLNRNNHRHLTSGCSRPAARHHLRGTRTR